MIKENIVSYRDILGMDRNQGGVMPIGILTLQKLISTISDQRNQINALENANKQLIITSDSKSMVIVAMKETIKQLERQTFTIRTITGIDFGDLG